MTNTAVPLGLAGQSSFFDSPQPYLAASLEGDVGLERVCSFMEHSRLFVLLDVVASSLARAQRCQSAFNPKAAVDGTVPARQPIAGQLVLVSGAGMAAVDTTIRFFRTRLPEVWEQFPNSVLSRGYTTRLKLGSSHELRFVNRSYPFQPVAAAASFWFCGLSSAARRTWRE